MLWWTFPRYRFGNNINEAFPSDLLEIVRLDFFPTQFQSPRNSIYQSRKLDKEQLEWLWNSIKTSVYIQSSSLFSLPCSPITYLLSRIVFCIEWFNTNFYASSFDATSIPYANFYSNLLGADFKLSRIRICSALFKYTNPREHFFISSQDSKTLLVSSARHATSWSRTDVLQFRLRRESTIRSWIPDE